MQGVFVRTCTRIQVQRAMDNGIAIVVRRHIYSRIRFAFIIWKSLSFCIFLVCSTSKCINLYKIHVNKSTSFRVQITELETSRFWPSEVNLFAIIMPSILLPLRKYIFVIIPLSLCVAFRSRCTFLPTGGYAFPNDYMGCRW